ncbi:hypothetical protein V6N11_024192 [Hibiscus sabdariffa]|uniref:Protein kinase domain-containing protein n=1 Tax=Hibiscus sabdariffa TaxID=183260 RepID=A0ABR2N7T5_9ROSI
MSKFYGRILDTTMFAHSHTKIQGFPSTAVAVKQLNPDGFQGDREWLAEINYLGQFSHPNLVKLIGYCCEDDHRLLVYEHMSSGCLEKHLFRRSGCGLTWSKRMKIALGAAKGLAFLHGAERPVIYRDFKSSNILLDEDFNAKLSDFGLVKDGPMGDLTHVSTRVMGTIGYAPLYSKNSRDNGQNVFCLVLFFRWSEFVQNFFVQPVHNYEHFPVNKIHVQ